MKLNIKYVPKKSKSGTMLYINLYWNNTRYQNSLGISVPEGSWNGSKFNNKNPSWYAINNKLDRISVELKKYFSVELNDYNHIPTKEEMVFKFNQIAFPDNKNKSKQEFIVLLNKFIKECEDGVYLTAYNARYSPRTVRIFQVARYNLLDFKENTKIDITLKNIVSILNDEFARFINNKKLQIETINMIIYTFKTFLKWANVRGYLHTPVGSQLKRRKSNDKNYLIALNEHEIKSIMSVELSGRSSIDRDIFLLQCYTGMRYSDIVNLTYSNYDKKNARLSISQKKTKNMIMVDLPEQAEAIIRKYTSNSNILKINEKLLPAGSLENYNKNLKKICKKAGIIENILVSKIKGGVEESVLMSKWQLIGSHTARRTFITLSLKFGLSVNYIKLITGHKSDSAFNKYIKITNEEAAKQVKNVWSKF